MSGSNGVYKGQPVNRELQIVNPRVRGTLYQTEDRLLLVAGQIPAATLFEKEILFDGFTPSALTLDTYANIVKYYSTKNKLEVGAGFSVTIINQDPNNTKTLTLPAGMTYFDTGLLTIAIPKTTRVTLFFEFTSADLSSIVVYTQSYSGMTNVTNAKQGAVAIGTTDGVVVTTDATEAALWTYGFVTGAITPRIQRIGSTSNTAGVNVVWNITGPIQKLASNTSANAGTVLTSIKMYYTLLNATTAVTVYPRVSYVSLTPFPGPTPASVTVPSSSNQPQLKPISAVTVAYEEIITLTTPLNIVDNMIVSVTLFSPTAGFPATAVTLYVYGGTAMVNYQYSV